MKINILGQGRHGKDTVAEYLYENYAMYFSSSSLAAAKIFIYDRLKKEKGYITFQECYDDRHSGDNRALWYDLITEYNKYDPARLAKDILQENDIYVGMRSKRELDACKELGLFDLHLGVYRPDAPKESKKSMDIDIFTEADIILINNGTLEDLYRKIDLLVEGWYIQRTSFGNQS